MTRKYTQKVRRRQKQMRDVIRTLETLERAEQPRKVGRPLSERRADARARQLPPDRKCEGCGEVVLESRRWVVVDGVARCLSCHRRNEHAD